MSCSSTYHINLLNGLKMKNMFFIIEKCSPFTFKEPGTDCHQHLNIKLLPITLNEENRKDV